MVQNAAGRAAIKGVSLKGTQSGSWQELNNDWGARWETGQQPYGYPFDMQVTQDDGQVVTCNGCLQEGTGQSQTSMQFKIAGSEDSATIVGVSLPPPPPPPGSPLLGTFHFCFLDP